MKRAKLIQKTIAEPVITVPELVRVLIVDDARVDRVSLMRICQQMDFNTEVFEATSLAQLDAMLTSQSFHLIFLDYRLPDGDGFSGLDLVLSSDKNRSAATILVMDDERTDIVIEAMPNGFSDVLLKDHLSFPVVRRASINALQKSSFAMQLEQHADMRFQVEDVLDRFTAQFASEIKPMLFRMMREVRSLEATRTDKAQHTETLLQISASCERLFDFMSDLGDQDRKALALKRTDPAPTERAVYEPVASAPTADEKKPRSMAERMSFFSTR